METLSPGYVNCEVCRSRIRGKAAGACRGRKLQDASYLSADTSHLSTWSAATAAAVVVTRSSCRQLVYFKTLNAQLLQFATENHTRQCHNSKSQLICCTYIYIQSDLCRYLMSKLISNSLLGNIRKICFYTQNLRIIIFSKCLQNENNPKKLLDQLIEKIINKYGIQQENNMTPVVAHSKLTTEETLAFLLPGY